MTSSRQELRVILGGLVTTVIVAFVAALMSTRSEFPVYSLMTCFLLPAGAIGCGFVAASGYYVVARLAHVRPWRPTGAAVVGNAVLSYILVRSFEWRLLMADARSENERIPFGKYLSLVLEHASLDVKLHSIALGSTPDLGSMGYVFAALQVTGFAGAGLIVIHHLRTLPWCTGCGRYLSKQMHQSRWFAEPASFRAAVEMLADRVTAGRLDDALAQHAAAGSPKAAKSALFQSHVEVSGCGRCGARSVHHTAHQRSDRGRWEPAEDLEFRSYVAPSGTTAAAA